MRIFLATWPAKKQVEQTLVQASAQRMARGMKIYGVAASGTTRGAAMSVPTQAWAQERGDLKIHLAERDPQHHSWPKNGVERGGLRLRILLSYHYYKDVDLDELFAKYFTEPFPDVFADSGAFSAKTQGAKIELGAYADWLHRWKHLFSAYSNLDVIGNHVASMRNQRMLEDSGLSPLPVFHVGSDMGALDEIIEEYQYIALGGMVPHVRFLKRLMPWLIECFRHTNSSAVFHGFGATSWEIVRSFPWYSVDSSSWGQGFRFGQVPLFDERQGRFAKANLGDHKSCYRYAHLFRRLGFDPADFADRERNDRAKICAISALSYMLAERWLRNWHGEIRIPQSPNKSSDPRICLVTGSEPHGNMSAAALSRAGLGGVGPRLHLADTSNGVNFGDASAGIRHYLVETGGALQDVRRVASCINARGGTCDAAVGA